MIKVSKIRTTFSFTDIIQVCFFLFLCGCMAHKTGTLFDALFNRLTFVLMIAVQILKSLKSRKIKIGMGTLWMLLLIGYYLLSALWAMEPQDTFYPKIINSFIQILGTIIVIEDNFHTGKDYLKLFQCVKYAVLYMTILLILRTDRQDWLNRTMGAALGVNANDIGLLAGNAVLLSLIDLKKHRSNLLLIALFTVVGLLSGSRKAFIIILLEIFFFFILKDRGLKKMFNILLAAAAGMALLYIVFKIPVFYNTVGYRVERAIKTILGIQIRAADGYIIKDGSSATRALFRRMAFSMFWQKPVFGWGGNSYVSYMRSISFRYVVYSHCNYTELLATLGLTGFLLYYGYVLSGLLLGFGCILKKHSRNVLLIMLSLAIHMVAEYYYVSYYSVLDMLMLLLSVNFIRIRWAEIQRPVKKQPERAGKKKIEAGGTPFDPGFRCRDASRRNRVQKCEYGPSGQRTFGSADDPWKNIRETE